MALKGVNMVMAGAVVVVTEGAAVKGAEVLAGVGSG